MMARCGLSTLGVGVVLPWHALDGAGTFVTADVGLATRVPSATLGTLSNVPIHSRYGFRIVVLLGVAISVA